MLEENDAVSNGKTNSKKISSKATFGNIYCKRPIFRRKLIEKYSTARYNFNTKLFLKKRSDCGKRKSRNTKDGTRIPRRNSSSLQNAFATQKGEPSPGYSAVTICEVETQTFSSEEQQNDGNRITTAVYKNAKSVVEINDEAGCRYSNSDINATILSDNGSNKMSLKNVKKSKKYICNSSTNSSNSSKLDETWKIAPKGVYDRLWETYVGKYDVKPEPKKEVKKRKKGGYRKKHSTKNVKHKVENLSFCDPYDDCVRELDNLSESVSRKSEKLGIVMYLGVNRPLFPLIYRNMRLLNANKDAQITDFWSEFALSTLVVKEEDRKCSPVLVSVKDSELYSLISEFNDGCVNTDLLDDSKSSSLPDSEAEKKCVLEVDVDVKLENDTFATQRQDHQCQRKPPQYVKTDSEFGGRGLPSTQENDPDGYEEQIESISVSLSQKSNSLMTPTAAKTVDQQLEEKLILKQFGYKECVVAIPKLGDREMRAIMGEDGAELSKAEQDRVATSEKLENEPDEEHHYFGPSHCTRTYGMMIDYLLRNRTLVHYYKLKKMLDFQKSNNKYFMCCDYVLIDRYETQDDVDITSTNADDMEDRDDNDNVAVAVAVAATADADADAAAAVPLEPESKNMTRKPFRLYALGMAESEFQPKVRSSRNPNDIFPYSRIKEFKDRTRRFSWVKMDKFRYVSNAKWLALKMDKAIASVCFAEQHVLRRRLLFEIVYRAELSKKVICCELDGSRNKIDELTFGVYAFPGLCDVVYIGPYALNEEHNLIASVRVADGQVKLAKIKTQEEKENFSQAEQSIHIQAKWWQGNEKIRCENPNDQYLRFVFDDPPTASAPQPDKCNIANILDQHDCLNYHTYEIGGGKEYNFVLFHDLTNTLHNTQNAAPVPAKRKINVARHRSIIERFLKRRRNDDEFEQNVNRRKRARKHFEGSAIYTLKEGVLRKRSQNPVRRYTEMHVTNERIRRLEFRNNKLNLAAVLKENLPVTPMESLVSILQKSMDMIKWLEEDTARQIEDAKFLRKKQAALMKKCVILLKDIDPKSITFKRGMNFLAKWKEMKLRQKNALVELLQTDGEEKSVSHVHTNRQINKKRTVARPSEKLFAAVENSKANIMRTNGEDVGSSQSKTELALEDSVKLESVSTEQSDGNILKLDSLEKRSACEISSCKNTAIEGDDTSSQAPQQQQQRRRRRRKPWSRRSRSKLQIEKVDDALKSEDLDSYYKKITTTDDRSTKTPSPVDAASTCNEEYKISPTNMPYVEHSYCLFNENVNNFKIENSLKSHHTRNMEAGKALLLDRYRERNRKIPVKPTTSIGPIINGSIEGPSFRAVIKEKSTDQVSIDIMENNHIFARLNIAKIRSQTGDSTAGGLGSDSKAKILNLMQKILSKMQSSVSVTNGTDKPNNERSRVMKRALLVQKLKSLIGKFEESKKERMYETIDSIEISDEESDRADENGDSQGDEKNEINLHAEEEFVLEEEEEEEEDENGVEAQTSNASGVGTNANSVASLCFDDDSETANIENIIIEEVYDDAEDDIGSRVINEVSSIRTARSNTALNARTDNSLRFIPVMKRTNISTVNSKKRVPVPILPKPVNAFSSAGNVVIHPKPKIKFVPNIIKFSEKPTNTGDLARVKVKTANTSFISVGRIVPPTILKRTWCRPVSDVQNHHEELSYDNSVTDMEEINGSEIAQSPPDDSENAIYETNELTDGSEFDGCNRVGLRPKSFACVGKFDQVFSNNVDKLLNPF